MGWQTSINMTTSQFSNISSLFCKCRRESWESSTILERHGLISHSCWIPSLYVSCKHSRAFHSASTNDWQFNCYIRSPSNVSLCRQKLQRCPSNSNPQWLLSMLGTSFWDVYSILVPTKRSSYTCW
jgi:hypothetical protein